MVITTARTHGFPYEWLERLQFNKTYNIIKELAEINIPSGQLQLYLVKNIR